MMVFFRIYGYTLICGKFQNIAASWSVILGVYHVSTLFIVALKTGDDCFLLLSGYCCHSRSGYP